MRTIATESFGKRLKSELTKNATLVTIGAVILIIAVGVTIVDNPANWWVAAVAALGVVGVLFLMVHGRVVIKAALSIFVMLISMSFAFNLGSMVQTTPLFGITWPMYILAAYAAALAFSYIVFSGRGRWTYLGFMSVIQFVLIYLFVSIGANPHLSAIVGTLIPLIFFVLVYTLNGRTRSKSKLMPQSAFDEEFYNAVLSGAEELSIGVRAIPARKDIAAHLLVYGENQAFILYPVNMEQAFGQMGRRGSMLSYKGKNINPWLSRLLYATSPSWKARGAAPMLVLVDMNRKNGADAKVIGVSIPDSKKVAAVGICPAPALKIERESFGERLLSKIVNSMSEYAHELSPKQIKAISTVGFEPERKTEVQS